MILGRGVSSVLTKEGEIHGLVTENLRGAQPPFLLHSVLEAEIPYARISRQVLASEVGEVSRAYGAGTRALMFLRTCHSFVAPNDVVFQSCPVGLTPVIVRTPDAFIGQAPFKATLIEGASDPSLMLDATTGQYHIFYWVNAWSPPLSPLLPPGPPTPEPVPIPEAAFPGTEPPFPTNYDEAYFAVDESDNPVPQPPSNNFMFPRDIPEWNVKVEGEEDDGRPVFGVGPFDITRFWIAPHTDAHLFRFPADFDPTPPPPAVTTQPEPIPGQPPAPPSPLEEGEESDNFTDLFPIARFPDTPTTRAVNEALGLQKQGSNLTPTQQATLTEYLQAPLRLANLARATRVLMYTRATLAVLRKQDEVDQTPGEVPAHENIKEAPQAYLVADPPQPVYAYRRAVNKVIATRQKMESFLGNGDKFITAPLNYNAPGPGTVTLTFGDPQVDYTIHDPYANFSDIRAGGILPESETSQRAPYTPEREFILPTAIPTSLVGLLSSPGSWRST